MILDPLILEERENGEGGERRGREGRLLIARRYLIALRHVRPPARQTNLHLEPGAKVSHVAKTL